LHSSSAAMTAMAPRAEDNRETSATWPMEEELRCGRPSSPSSGWRRERTLPAAARTTACVACCACAWAFAREERQAALFARFAACEGETEGEEAEGEGEGEAEGEEAERRRIALARCSPLSGTSESLSMAAALYTVTWLS
jgi:hypothetical protein